MKNFNMKARNLKEWHDESSRILFAFEDVINCNYQDPGEALELLEDLRDAVKHGDRKHLAVVMADVSLYLKQGKEVSLERKMEFREAMIDHNNLFNELWERQYGPVLTARSQAI